MDDHDFMKWARLRPSAATWWRQIPIDMPEFGKRVTCRASKDEDVGKLGTRGWNSFASFGWFDTSRWKSSAADSATVSETEST